MFFLKSHPHSQGYSYNIFFFQISPLMFLFNQFLYKKSVGEELIYRRRDFNLLPCFCLAPLDSPPPPTPHWRSQSSGYEYLWMDVNLSAVDKLPLIITGKGQ